MTLNSLILLNSMRSLFFTILTVVVLLGSQSCKEGCTNPNAFNYDSKAKSDDASCMYCDTAWEPMGTSFDMISDNNPNSQFAFQSVLTLNTQSNIQVFSGNACTKYGFVSNAECNTFNHQLLFTNLTNKTITFSGTVLINYSTFNGSASTSVPIPNMQIPPNQTVATDPVGRICVANSGGFSASIISQNLSYN